MKKKIVSDHFVKTGQYNSFECYLFFLEEARLLELEFLKSVKKPYLVNEVEETLVERWKRLYAKN